MLFIAFNMVVAESFTTEQKLSAFQYLQEIGLECVWRVMDEFIDYVKTDFPRLERKSVYLTKYSHWTVRVARWYRDVKLLSTRIGLAPTPSFKNLTVGELRELYYQIHGKYPSAKLRKAELIALL